MPDSDNRPIVLGVVTFQRPDGLERLLTSLINIDAPTTGWEVVGTVVVDNDPARSAEAVVRRFENVTYVCEPEPGIAAARNSAIDQARELGAHWIAFVDDDQTVTRTWLTELTRAASAQSADAVIGAVRYHHPPTTPEWFRGLGIFEDQLVNSRQFDQYFTTNNLLLRVHPWPVPPPLFDPAFGLTGGSDHHLGARLRRRGASVAFAPGAFADEIVLAHRIDSRQAIRRLLRNGNVMVRTDRAIAREHGESETAVRLRGVGAGAARMGVGITRALRWAPSGTRGMANGLKTSIIGVGQILGSAGHTIREYERESASTSVGGAAHIPSQPLAGESTRRVAIGVASFRRPEGLGALLQSFASLEDLSPDWELCGIVVVDNDPDRSAEATVRSACVDVTYFCEPQPGISAARNRAVDGAKELGAHWIAFIDDDQTVTPMWLKNLTAEAHRRAANAVIGAVRYHHPPGTPAWFRGLRVFEDQLVDGPEEDNYFTTNNLLLQIDPPPVEPPLFDQRFGLSGGSDHHLGARLERRGLRIGFAPDAFADEVVLADRVNLHSGVRRILRNGNVMARTDRALALEFGESETVARTRCVLAGLIRIPAGMVRGIAGMPHGVWGVASGLRTSLIGVGQIHGALGGSVQEYQR